MNRSVTLINTSDEDLNVRLVSASHLAVLHIERGTSRQVALRSETAAVAFGATSGHLVGAHVLGTDTVSGAIRLAQNAQGASRYPIL